MSYKKGENRIRRPFRFLASWMLHEGFESFIKDFWENNGVRREQILTFQEALQKGNRDVFGNIFNRKRKLLRRLDIISF